MQNHWDIPPSIRFRKRTEGGYISKELRWLEFFGHFFWGLLAATDPSILSGYRQGIIKIPVCWIVTYWTIMLVAYCTYFTQKPKYWLVLKFWYIGMRYWWPKILKSSPDWTTNPGNFKGKLFVKLDFGVVKSSPMCQNFNVSTYFHPGNNWQSVFHRYHGPVGHYLAQGDFDDALSITRQNRGISSVQKTPKKVLRKTSIHFLCQIFRKN